MAGRLGTSYDTILRRVKTCQRLGADLSEVVATPPDERMPCVSRQATPGQTRELRHRKKTYIEFCGERLTISPWARKLETSYTTIYKRVKICDVLGADLTQAVATPIGEQMPCVYANVERGRPLRRRHRKQTTIEYRGKRLTITQWARQLGVSYLMIYKRVKTCQALGADLSEAVTTPMGDQMPCARGTIKRGRPRRRLPEAS